MLIQLLICLIAIPKPTTQICAKGCLSCNASNECLLCDLISSYAMDVTNLGCKLCNVENCKTYDSSC